MEQVGTQKGRNILGVVLLAALAAGPALAAGGDAVYAAEGTIGNQWSAAGDFASAVYPAQWVGRGDNVCLALGYRIRKDGTTGDFRVIDQWSSAGGRNEPAADYFAAFADAAATAVSQWRFQPRAGGAPETYTVATVGFSAGNGGDAGALRAHCASPGPDGIRSAYLRDVRLEQAVRSAWAGSARRSGGVAERTINPAPVVRSSGQGAGGVSGQGAGSR